MKVYMHTLNGKPAFFAEEYQAIYFTGNNSFTRRDFLRTNLKQIRKEQEIDLKNSIAGFDRGYVGFYLKEPQ